MPVNTKTNLGSIKITDNAIANLVGSALCECYGIVGVTTKNYIVDGYYDLMKIENYAKGVVVKNNKGNIEVDLYIVVSYGILISEVVNSVQERVKYTIDKTLNMDVSHVNVHVMGVKVI